MSARREVTVELGGRALTLSNLEKVFYPACGFTKGDVIDYYARIAPAILPHLRERPLTLKRYPDGASGPFFYEKRCPSHRPAWVRTEAVWSPGNADHIHFCVADDLPSLVWAANMASIELHTYLHRAPAVDRPTALVLDLDPGPPADIVACCDLALLVRDALGRLGLRVFPKTSGSKGLQLYAPLHTPVTYDATKAFARAVAEGFEAAYPSLVVSSMKKALRVGKVLVDWSQNDQAKTTVSVWSLRAKERPTVSTPLRWSEVEEVVRSRQGERLVFEASQAVARFERDGDLFAEVETLAQRLPHLDALAAGLSPGAPSTAAPRAGKRRPPKGRASRRQARPAPPPDGGDAYHGDR